MTAFSSHTFMISMMPASPMKPDPFNPRQEVQLRDTDTTILSVKKNSGMLMTLAKTIVRNLINFLGDIYIITHFVNKAYWLV